MKRTLIYMYRTLLKCVSTPQVEKALRIITVIYFIIKLIFLFFLFFYSTLQVLITISLKIPPQAFFHFPRREAATRGKTQKFGEGSGTGMA